MKLEAHYKTPVSPMKFITTIFLRVSLPQWNYLSVSYILIPSSTLSGVQLHKSAPIRSAMGRQVSQPTIETFSSDQKASHSGCTSAPPPKDLYKSKFKEPATDLAKVKSLAARLQLSTRRQSYVAWLSDNEIMAPRLRCACKCSSREREDELQCSAGRIKVEGRDMHQTLSQLKSELQCMKAQDQSLARQFLHLYSEVLKLRLSWSCQVHEELLDELQFNMEELQQLPNVLDFPAYFLDCPLKHVGVTRLNLSARRFSTC